MTRQTLEELGIEVKESRTHGLADPSILPESDVHSLDLLFDIGKITFRNFTTNPYVIELINERVKNARKGLRNGDDSLAIIAAEESLWQLVFVNYLGSNDFLHNHIVEQWDVLKEIFPNTTRNETSTLKNFKSILVNDPLDKAWTYLLDRETVSEPICSFLFPFEYATKGRIFASSLGIGYAFMDAKIWNRAAREFEVAIER